MKLPRPIIKLKPSALIPHDDKLCKCWTHRATSYRKSLMISPLTLGQLGPKWLPEPSWGGAEQSCAVGGGPQPSATSMLCVPAATQTTKHTFCAREPPSYLLEKTYSPFRRAEETTSGLVHAHHLVAWAAWKGPHFTAHNPPPQREEPARVPARCELSPQEDTQIHFAPELRGFRTVPMRTPQAEPARTPHWESSHSVCHTIS